MNYKVLIKRCGDPERAQRVAEEIARWSGSTVDKVLAAIMAKSVCIRKEAGEAEARDLKARFEAVGAQVELMSLGSPVPAGGRTAVNDEDEDDEDGRILSDEEYRQQLAKRADIFTIEKDTRLRNVELVCLALGIVVGAWLSTREIVEVATDFFEKVPEERVAKIVKEVESPLDKKKEEEKKEEIKTEKKKIKPSKKKGAGGRTGGGGDPRARVTDRKSVV